MAAPKIKGLLDKIANSEGRYRAILRDFGVHPEVLGSMIAISHGIGIARDDQSLENAAFDISRTLLSFVMWLEFGPNQASPMVPILCRLLADPAAKMMTVAEPEVSVTMSNKDKPDTVGSYEIHNEDRSLNKRELGRYIHTMGIDVLERSGVEAREIVRVMAAAIRHVAYNHMTDRNAAIKLLANVSKLIAEDADAMADDFSHDNHHSAH